MRCWGGSSFLLVSQKHCSVNGLSNNRLTFQEETVFIDGPFLADPDCGCVNTYLWW